MGYRPGKEWLCLAAAAAVLAGAGLGFAGNQSPATAPASADQAPIVGPALAAAGGPATVPATRPTKTPEEKKQEDIARVMEFFRVTQPDVFEQANALRATDPAKFDKLIADALSTVHQLEIMKKNKPKLFELSMKDLQLGYLSLRLAHELKRADLSDADRKQITKELQETIAMEFDVQQKIRQYELDELQAKVRRLNDHVKARDAEKDKILQKRADDLIKGTPRLEW